MLGDIHFIFNELDTEWELCSQVSVSFFNVLDIEWELCSQAYVSFFNELDIESKLVSTHGFIFMQA